MHLRSTVSLISRVSVLILAACGPEKGPGEGDTSSGETTADTTGTTTDDAPTGTATGTTEATTGTGTGTTGDAGQPLFCNGEPPNKPACVEVCVRDVDPETPLVDPSCGVAETRADMTSVELPVCVAVMDSWQPPAGEAACFVMLIDMDGKHTPSAIDNMSPECVDAGHNAEIMLIRTAPPMAGACVFVTCERSENVMRDCPNL